MRPIFSKVLQIINTFSINDILPKGSSYKKVSFVPKAYPDDTTPWITFGSTKEEYKRWIPEVCGICCLKMVGDTFNLTLGHSLYDLTMQCFKKGGFKIRNNGSITGVFHRPLIQLAQELGLQGLAERDIDTSLLIQHLENNRLVILSIDLGKATSSFNGNHLILVHRYLPEQGQFLVHDCAFVVGKSGFNIPVSIKALESMSNRRGMAVWKKAD